MLQIKKARVDLMMEIQDRTMSCNDSSRSAINLTAVPDFHDD